MTENVSGPAGPSSSPGFVLLVNVLLVDVLLVDDSPPSEVEGWVLPDVDGSVLAADDEVDGAGW